MMASVVTTGPDALRVDAVFYKADDLAGLIWEAEDRCDHPLLALRDGRDFRRLPAALPLAIGGREGARRGDGPTLTIEGRDEGGAARSWFVRLWNYADGTPRGRGVSARFRRRWPAAGQADDPVWAGDVDRMFVSLVAPGYTRRGRAAGGAGGGLGGAERDRLRRLRIGAGDRRRAGARASACGSRPAMTTSII